MHVFSEMGVLSTPVSLGFLTVSSAFLSLLPEKLDH